MPRFSCNEIDKKTTPLFLASLCLAAAASLLFASLKPLREVDANPASEREWIQKTFSDFRAGTFEDGGANLYVTAAGQIRSIYTFDYNRDGANDILFPCGHDVNDAPPTYLYMNGGQGLDERYRWELLNDGAKSGLVSDLNKDGFPDIVVCGTSNGMATRVPLDSIVYYGNGQGFFPTSSTRLPTFYAESVTQADLNGDGWDDLIFTQSKDLPVLVYWNGPDGFNVCRKTELPIKCSHLLAGDIDGDGRPDLLAVTSSGVNVYHGNGHSVDTDPILRLDAPGATRCIAFDLDKDGKLDIVVANGKPDSNSYVFWNDGKDFTARPRTELPTMRASGCAAGDLNSDGYPDLAFSNTSLKDGRKGEINSVVYWGSKAGFSKEQRLELPTQWASQCAIGDINGDGFPDLVFVNRTSLTRLDTESFVYWGGRDGLSVKRRQTLPTSGATDLVIADVNGDHRPDVVFFNGAAGFNGDRYLRVYWNDGKGGFSTERKLEIPASDCISPVCADFNNDGYLDWAVPNSSEYTLPGEGADRGTYIYWGDASGIWSERKRSTFKTHSAFGAVTADLNHDGYLDLVVPQSGDPEHRQLIFWGGPDGFKDDHTSALHTPNPIGATLADFNKDGWLDIVITE
ncbi:MAG TPA: VCBS repeat-containing protein, partial [Acidobacteriota bacterium]